MNNAHIPSATYRLQFYADFPLKCAKNLISFLKDLGISDIYTSPLTQAVTGSQHGYDVVNPCVLNREICNYNELKRFSKILHKNGLFLLMDFVPNHMSTSSENIWWNDVLKKGKKSKFIKYFDVHFEKKELKYRCFFDINELVCLHIENKNVFEKVHTLIWKLLEDKIISGLRIDHIDGLYDPATYLKRLKNKSKKIINNNLYIIVEKILAASEHIPSQWDIAGTTGYDFLNATNCLFIHKKGYLQLVRNFRSLTRIKERWSKIRYLSKRKVIEFLFSSETLYLVNLLKKIRNIDIDEYKYIITTLTATLPLYRSYVNNINLDKEDSKNLMKTFDITGNMTKFLKKILFKDSQCKMLQNKKSINWIMAWQQYSGPVMAKGYEDTACYIYNPLVSINEVGSDPEMEKYFGDIKKFHNFLKHRQVSTPHSLNATSTHDTKRSEDCRLRLNVLSEIPNQWIDHVRIWRKILKPTKLRVKGNIVPDPNLEILFFQNLLGAWPISSDRIKNYLIKVVREQKIHSSWKTPHHDYECALAYYVDNLFKCDLFIQKFTPFQDKIAFHGALNSLSELLLKMTAPGIPDFYQGTELWNLKLVDPDNRERVEFSQAKSQLKNCLKINPIKLNNLRKNWKDGAIKLFLIYQTLQFRKSKLNIFQYGNYLPIESFGLFKNNIVSFGRCHHQQWVIVIVPRFTTKISRSESDVFGKFSWKDTKIILPKNTPLKFKNILTNEVIKCNIIRNKITLSVDKLLYKFPVALLSGINLPARRAL